MTGSKPTRLWMNTHWMLGIYFTWHINFGHTVLVYQFVAELKPNLKPELAGVEGTCDQLLVKARFKEAKAHDLSLVSTTSTKAQ